MCEKESLESAIHDAENFHGHLGPFLVIGVRMGRIAKQVLGTDIGDDDLRADVRVPLSTPFSCVLDGIQVTSRCTIGNQRLGVKNSEKEISAHFERKSPGRALRICLNPEIAEGVVERLSHGSSLEELAREVARLPESALFTVEM